MRCIWVALRFVFMSKAHFVLFLSLSLPLSLSTFSLSFLLYDFAFSQFAFVLGHVQNAHVIHLCSSRRWIWQETKMCCSFVWAPAMATMVAVLLFASPEKTFGVAQIHIHCMMLFCHLNTQIGQQTVKMFGIQILWLCNTSIALLLYLNVNKNKNGIIPWVKLISSLNLLLHSLHIHRLLP